MSDHEEYLDDPEEEQGSEEGEFTDQVPAEEEGEGDQEEGGEEEEEGEDEDALLGGETDEESDEEDSQSEDVDEDTISQSDEWTEQDSLWTPLEHEFIAQTAMNIKGRKDTTPSVYDLYRNGEPLRKVFLTDTFEELVIHLNDYAEKRNSRSIIRHQLQGWFEEKGYDLTDDYQTIIARQYLSILNYIHRELRHHTCGQDNYGMIKRKIYSL